MALFNLSPAIALLSNELVTVRRRGADTFVNGRRQARTYSTIVVGVSASVQPLSGAELAKLPEGENSSEWATLYVPAVLLEGDVIDCVRGTFQVRKLNDWQPHGVYSKAMIRKFDTGEVP